MVLVWQIKDDSPNSPNFPAIWYSMHSSLPYVTEFAKTLHIHTRIEIHFVAYFNSHTSALSRHRNNKTGIDKQVCFYRWPVVDPVKWRRTIIDPVRPLRGINGVAWGPILSHCMSAWLVVWSGLLWPSVWPTVHTTWSPVSTGIVKPPTLPLHPPHPPPTCPPSYTRHSWYCRLCSKHLSKPASPTSSYIC